MRHSLDTKLLQDLLNYLVERPFKETNALISSIQQDAKVVVEPAPEAAKTEEKEESDASKV